MKAVKFLMSHTLGALYNKDEVAGFPDDVADDLIKRKIAEPVKGTKAKATDPADPNTLDDAALDKLIASEKVKVAADADREAKIAAVLAARAK